VTAQLVLLPDVDLRRAPAARPLRRPRRRAWVPWQLALNLGEWSVRPRTPQPLTPEQRAWVQGEAARLALDLQGHAIPEPRGRGRIRGRYLLHRWGWGPLEVWSLSPQLSADDRRLFRRQWLRLQVTERMGSRPTDGLSRAVEDAVLARLGALVEA
jgi:hypothetical protein